MKQIHISLSSNSFYIVLHISFPGLILNVSSYSVSGIYAESEIYFLMFFNLTFGETPEILFEAYLKLLSHVETIFVVAVPQLPFLGIIDV